MLRRGLSSLPPARPALAKKDKLVSLLQARVEEHPTKDVVHFLDDRRISVGKLDVHARAVGTGLSMLHHNSTSQPVLAVMPNNLERLVTQLACLYSGTKLFMPDKYAFEEFDVAALLQASRPRSLFVTSNLVRKVRAAVPELTPAGFQVTDAGDTRHHVGSMNDGLPISARDVPELKHCFHTGSGREGKFSRFRDLLVYYPTKDVLGYAPSLDEQQDVFLTVLSPKGQVVKQATINDIYSEAQRVHREVQLGADEKLLLATSGDPLSTLVAAVASIGAKAQLIVPGRVVGDAGQLAKSIALEQVTCAVGSQVSVPVAAARVAQFA